MIRSFASAVLLLLALASGAAAQAPVSYRISFPEPEHRWMQVEATFPDLPPAPLDLHMSRSSPGRYSLHEFAKNVWQVEVTDGAGTPLRTTRPGASRWVVPVHGAVVRVRYRVFGDRADGTYLGIDSTHAHVNMPAAILWAAGLETRSIAITFEPPQGVRWLAATQLFPTTTPFSFTAPNLQYLMDSPVELSAFTMRQFSVQDGGRTPLFRVAVHHTGSAEEAATYARSVETIVREARAVFGEFAPFDGNTYTVIADYLPWASGDAMEHRNSTVITSPSSLSSDRLDPLGSVAHEFFHSWNVERIRPRSLEPFNLDDVNVSGELWLAEGFTNYYGPLVLVRSGLSQVGDFADEMGYMINTVLTSPGRHVRTAEEVSQLAPFTDMATPIDRTNIDNTFISYYSWGGALGIGLDLTLRDRSNGRVTLDDLMRALWRRFGKPGGRAPGYVDRPYTMTDVKATLAEVAGDARFADDFFARFVQGHEVLDYRRLLALGGLVMRLANPGSASAGAIKLQDSFNGARVADTVPFGSPAYAAGLEQDDVIVSIDAKTVRSAADVESAIRDRRPGNRIPVVFERRGERVTTTLALVQDPAQEVVPVERTGGSLTPAQRRFREAWLGSAQR